MARRQVVVEESAGDRQQALKVMLEDRRREILSEVKGRVIEVRQLGQDQNHGVNSESGLVEGAVDDVELMLIAMKAENLNRINDALERLNQGAYGRCEECGDEISPARLRALMFATRCKDCDEAREIALQRERQMSTTSSRMMALWME